MSKDTPTDDAPDVEIINDGPPEDVDPASLTPHPKNPRRGDVDAIAESMRANGFSGSVKVDRRTNVILAGHHTVKAAIQVGIEKVPVQYLKIRDDDHAVAVLLSENRTADLATYDKDELADLLDEREDLSGTGYTHEDVSDILAGLGRVTPTYSNPGVVVGPDEDQYGVIVICTGEAEQAALFERLTAEGLDCRVVVA